MISPAFALFLTLLYNCYILTHCLYLPIFSSSWGSRLQILSFLAAPFRSYNQEGTEYYDAVVKAITSTLSALQYLNLSLGLNTSLVWIHTKIVRVEGALLECNRSGVHHIRQSRTSSWNRWENRSSQKDIGRKSEREA